MKTLKLLSIFLFALFLVSTASAVAVYGDWQDSSQSIAITNGQSVILNADFISVNPPITLSVKVYDNSSNLVYSFEDSTVIENYSYFPSYELTKTIYKNVGDYEIILTASDKVNSDSHTLNLRVNAVVVPDTTAPVITLVGPSTINLTQGNAYNELGATALDNIDGIITGKIVITNPVNVFAVGTYTVRYNVKDSAGNNASEVTRIVNVLPGTGGDVTPPVITLLGSNDITLNLGTAYTEYGATALDNVDGDITGKIIITNPVNVYAVGTYTVRYNVKDNSGNNASEVTRTVNVVSSGGADTTSPVITLLGNSTVTVALGITYVDAGATASDNLDGDITSNITVVNPVNTSIVGTYTITYNVKDKAGNSALEVTRIVGVYNPNDTIAPLITVIKPLEGKRYSNNITLEVEVNELAEVEFSLDNGNRTAMNLDGVTNGILSFTYDTALNNGLHTVVFYAKDTAGNTGSKSISFSIGASTIPSNKKNSNSNVIVKGETNTEEQEYLNQFKKKQVLYLTEDETPSTELSSWQKFLKFSPILLIIIIVLLVLGMILIRR